MDRYYIDSILVLYILATVGNVNAFASYKWVCLKSGDPLPENIVSFKGLNEWYVGRSKASKNYEHSVRPAFVNANGSALRDVKEENFEYEEFEVLTSTDGCGWEEHSKIEEYGGNIVRAGTYYGGPVVIGYKNQTSNKVQELMTTGDYKDMGIPESTQYLYCNVSTKWITYSPNMILPNNLISGGISKNGAEMFVARWKSDDYDDGYRMHIGQVHIQQNGAAFAFFDNRVIIEKFDVLIGEPNQYTWVSAGFGKIPDYAVTLYENLDGTSEFAIVGRIENTIKRLKFDGLRDTSFDILVYNQPTTTNNDSTHKVCGV